MMFYYKETRDTHMFVCGREAKDDVDDDDDAPKAFCLNNILLTF